MLDMPNATAIARYLSLASQQMRLTASNMANVNTEGYYRRSVSWTSADTVSVGGYAVGTGVSAAVTVLRDRVLQKSVQQANEAASASSTRSTALDSLQSLFAIDSNGADAAGIGAAITGFFSSATTLAASPTDSNARQSMYSAAQNLAAVMNRTSTQIANQGASLNQQVTTAVSQVNALARSIASLNQQIGASGSSDTVDSLQDQRDLMISNLSKLAGVNTFTGSDGSIGIALSDGTPLVTGSIAQPLSLSNVNGSVQVHAADNRDVTGAITGGSIGGALTAIHVDLPAVSSALDSIAVTVAAAVNAQNAAGTDANGNPGGDIFSGSTAATLTLAISSASGIAASSDGSNAKSMGALADGTLVNGQTASAAFASLIARLGQTASTASTQSKSDAAILTQTSTQLSAVSGVSLDTEAANLTQYQRSYQAAAKVLSIVNELMAQAINLGQPTTVS